MDPNKIPIDKKIHETSTQFFICLAQVLFTEPDIKAASEEEKIIDVPTYPKYNIGG